MRKELGWIAALILVAAFVAAAIACGVSSDDDDNRLDDDDTSDMDQFADDDSGADDTTSDDADDTADDDTIAPEIVDAFWDPPSFTWQPSCADPDTPCTRLYWSLCDADNDMLPDGLMYIYNGSTWENPIHLSDLDLSPQTDFSNCGVPIVFARDLFVSDEDFPGPGTYEFSAGVKAGDSHGNMSEPVMDVILSIKYNG